MVLWVSGKCRVKQNQPGLCTAGLILRGGVQGTGEILRGVEGTGEILRGGVEGTGESSSVNTPPASSHRATR